MHTHKVAYVLNLAHIKVACKTVDSFVFSQYKLVLA